MRSQQAIDPEKFARFLWGDIFFDEEKRKFKRDSQQGSNPRSFVYYVLEPFYKVIAVSISEERPELEPILSRLGVYLKKKDFQMDIKPLVKLVLRKLLGDMSCFTDLLVANIPHSKASTKTKVARLYQNESENVALQRQLEACDPDGPLCINIVKLFNNEMEDCFYAFGRVISGTLSQG